MPGAGLEPARPYGQRIFLPLRLSPPAHAVRGLGDAFSVRPAGRLGGSRLVSTLCRFSRHTVPALARRCHQPITC
jgi:hypothetical protein